MPSAAPVTAPTIPLTAAPPTAPAAAVVASAARLTVFPALRTAPPTTPMMTPGFRSLSLQTVLATCIPVEREVNSYNEIVHTSNTRNAATLQTRRQRAFVWNSVLPQVDENRGVVAGCLALALLSDDLRIGHAAGQRR